VDLYDLVDLASEGGSYTDIEVGCLKEEVAAALADNFKIRAITSEVRGWWEGGGGAPAWVAALGCWLLLSRVSWSTFSS
jgi:hypothetical protein